MSIVAFTHGSPPQNFQLVKINAFKQFHIARRIGPILAEILPAMDMGKLKGGKFESLGEADQFDLVAKIASPVMAGLAKLSDEEAEKVLLGLLSGVQVQQSIGNWAFVATDAGGLMFQNFELPLLLHLAGRSFMHNLSGFFDALPQK